MFDMSNMCHVMLRKPYLSLATRLQMVQNYHNLKLARNCKDSYSLTVDVKKFGNSCLSSIQGLPYQHSLCALDVSELQKMALEVCCHSGIEMQRNYTRILSFLKNQVSLKGTTRESSTREIQMKMSTHTTI